MSLLESFKALCHFRLRTLYGRFLTVYDLSYLWQVNLYHSIIMSTNLYTLSRDGWRNDMNFLLPILDRDRDCCLNLGERSKKIFVSLLTSFEVSKIFLGVAGSLPEMSLSLINKTP